MADIFTGAVREIAAGWVVAAAGSHALEGPYPALKEAGLAAITIGDCAAPRTALDAVFDGYMAAVAL